jgi:hypothetical protein
MASLGGRFSQPGFIFSMMAIFLDRIQPLSCFGFPDAAA